MKIGSKGKKILTKIGLELTKINFVMDYFLKWGEKEILKHLVIKNERDRPIGAQEEKYYVVTNLMKAFEKKLKENTLAPSVRDWVFNKLIGEIIELKNDLAYIQALTGLTTTRKRPKKEEMRRRFLSL